MRDDLLDAHAAVDWAVAKLPTFKERLDAWLEFNMTIVFEDPNPSFPQRIIVATEREPLPLRFNVEMGAYINTIRSALDILASALAFRYGIPKPEDAYFPIARSRAAFDAGGYKGAKFVKALPDLERRILENLSPYAGGDELLWSLHQLDIVRKHRRLIAVDARPVRFSIWGENLRRHYEPVVTGWMRSNQKTILGTIAKDAPYPKFQATFTITITEPGLLEHKPAIAALSDFATHVARVIKLFDD